jgi:hyaluronan synthase
MDPFDMEDRQPSAGDSGEWVMGPAQPTTRMRHFARQAKKAYHELTPEQRIDSRSRTDSRPRQATSGVNGSRVPLPRSLAHARDTTKPAIATAPPSKTVRSQPIAPERGQRQRSGAGAVQTRATDESFAARAPAEEPSPAPPPARTPVPHPTPRPSPRPADRLDVFQPTEGSTPLAERIIARTAAVIIFSLCSATIFTLRWENVDYYWYRPFLNAYSVGVAAFILSRFAIALFYRPPRDIGLEPTVSIVITAFNEEDAIYRTVACCYAVDYPRKKLEVIAVDDGSKDRTYAVLRRAQERWPDLLIERFAKNKGKRVAMAAGARRGRGEILLYVDSDSFLRRDAVRKIVQGFADPEVAAVSGHTDVANAHANMLTRMQDVRYYVAFRVMKAAESVFGAVTCCPGCFSAYRRSSVLSILDRWLHQRFLGVQATFGDDRSLTNFLLRRYKVIYSADAVAVTIVPEHHFKFLKQQLRWKKSWLRECLIASTFMWKKHPLAVIGFYAQLVFPIIAPILLLRAFVWLPLTAGDAVSMAIYGLGVLMIGFVFSSYYLFWRANGSWIYGAYFTIYYMFVLVWQMPYAIATSRDNRWGTR